MIDQTADEVMSLPPQADGGFEDWPSMDGRLLVPGSEEVDALLAVYALDAVDGDEQTLVEDYLEMHPEAQWDVASLRRLAEGLRSTNGPRPEVWERIAAQLQFSSPVSLSEVPVPPDVAREGLTSTT